MTEHWDLPSPEGLIRENTSSGTRLRYENGWLRGVRSLHDDDVIDITMISSFSRITFAVHRGRVELSARHCGWQRSPGPQRSPARWQNAVFVLFNRPGTICLDSSAYRKSEFQLSHFLMHGPSVGPASFAAPAGIDEKLAHVQLLARWCSHFSSYATFSIIIDSSIVILIILSRDFNNTTHLLMTLLFYCLYSMWWQLGATVTIPLHSTATTVQSRFAMGIREQSLKEFMIPPKARMWRLITCQNRAIQAY
ncbi:hypothetical protein CIRG_04661 [Coccidioides immitis RMSCC 2394]|uniref:Uncharacterized protein n=1 Tax=Coccidioides immitis RMSCC 2394 TaxID=404692 RepID=A0A0J6YB66_COCIT|nr:hypothetical protein CIRG_04661 [Coccidioides immitis RMSCC 2394]